MKSFSLCLFICLTLTTVHAHEASTSYLYWHDQRPSTLRLDMAVTDLMVYLNESAPEQLSWRELQSISGPLGQQLLAGLTIRQGATVCPAQSELRGITRYTGETFASWQIYWHCPHPLRATTLSYRLLFAQDPLHRAVLNREGVLDSGIQILGRTSPPITLAPIRWPIIAAAIIVICTAALLAMRRLRR